MSCSKQKRGIRECVWCHHSINGVVVVVVVVVLVVVVVVIVVVLVVVVVVVVAGVVIVEVVRSNSRKKSSLSPYHRWCYSQTRDSTRALGVWEHVGGLAPFLGSSTSLIVPGIWASQPGNLSVIAPSASTTTGITMILTFHKCSSLIFNDWYVSTCSSSFSCVFSSLGPTMSIMRPVCSL